MGEGAEGCPVALVRGYQRWISPALPPTCRFFPSCSDYAREAIDSLVIRGSFPPLMLAPVNFDALYLQALKQAQDKAQRDRVEAKNGLEAVEKYKELRPDLTTMDIVMPFKSGIEATREIIKADPRAVIVMCSALGQESLVMEAIEAGASDFIVKPFKSEDVLSVVKKVLGD